MARVSYNPGTSTVSFDNVAHITVVNTSIVTANASTFALRAQLTGTIAGTLDVVYGGNFTLLAGVPIGGAFTSVRVDLNSQTLLQVTDFNLPYGAGPPDFSNLSVFLGGDDVLSGAALNDILEGFAGADTMDGGAGLDIMNGNAGNDTLMGGDGNDVVRGGKDNDVVMGGAGNDFVSGDRGADTLTGGAGADLFHTFAGAGVDRVTDFSRAEGDQVLVLGTQYTVSQVGADTVVDLGSGTQMTLVGVQMSTLTAGWIISI